MRQHFRAKMSCYKSMYKVNEPFTLTLEEVIERTKLGNDTLINQIDKIRDPKTTAKDRQSLKKSLLAISFCGTFSKRSDKALLHHSGMICLDFDKYPNEKTLQEERKKIEADPITTACFRSPSGKGLKVLVRIPKSTAEEHTRRFTALKKYFNSKYLDNTPDVSRLCYGSYDPDTYFKRYDSIEFTEIDGESKKSTKTAPKKEVKPTQKPTTPKTTTDNNSKEGFTVELTTSDKLEICLNNAQGDPAQDYNEWIKCGFGLADEFGESGFIYFDEICRMHSDYDQKETRKQYDNCLKTSNGTTKIDTVFYQLSKVGGTWAQEAKELNRASKSQGNNTVKQIDHPFTHVKTTKTGDATVHISKLALKQWYTSNGFIKVTNEDKNFFYYLKDNVLTEVYPNNMIDTAIEFTEGFEWEDKAVVNEFFAAARDSFFNILKTIKPKKQPKSLNHSYLYFKDTALKISANGVEPIKYKDLGFHIYKEQILQRNYAIINEVGEYETAMNNIFSDAVKSANSAFGYLLHDYKSQGSAKAVLLHDSDINTSSKIANGGRGKGLVGDGCENMTAFCGLDGKTIVKDDKFLLQTYKEGAKVLHFADIKKTFNIDSIFNYVSKDMTVERKNKGAVSVKFEDSPKILLDTNYALSEGGNSYKRRAFDLFLSDYYLNNPSPLEANGRNMFSEWDGEEWAKFNNYMIKNIQLFINEGLISQDHHSARERDFIAVTNTDFYDFVTEEIEHLYANGQFHVSNHTRSEYEETIKYKINTKQWSELLKQYADYMKMNIDFKKNAGQRGFIMTPAFEDPKKAPF